MSYIAGTQGLGGFGVPDGPPRIVCDGCGMVRRLNTDRPPPKWFLDMKAPPGWKRTKALPRRDWCPRCQTEGQTTIGQEPKP
jgi:hypothetical protein